jgi:hypothetical protein
LEASHVPLERFSGSYTVCIESRAVRDLPLGTLDEARRRMAEQAAGEPGLNRSAVFFNGSSGTIVVIFQTQASDFAQVAQIAVGFFTHALSGGADGALPVQTLFIEHGAASRTAPLRWGRPARAWR